MTAIKKLTSVIISVNSFTGHVIVAKIIKIDCTVGVFYCCPSSIYLSNSACNF